VVIGHCLLLPSRDVIERLFDKLGPENLVYDNCRSSDCLLVPSVDSFAARTTHLNTQFVGMFDGEFCHFYDVINEVLHVALDFAYYIELFVKVEFLLPNTSDNTSDIWPTTILLFIHFEVVDSLEDFRDVSLGVDLTRIITIRENI